MIVVPPMRRIEELRREYPTGCKIILDFMDDKNAPPKGTRGTVIGVDDLGGIIVRWDNGSMLSVIDGVDRCHRV